MYDNQIEPIRCLFKDFKDFPYLDRSGVIVRPAALNTFSGYVELFHIQNAQMFSKRVTRSTLKNFSKLDE